MGSVLKGSDRPLIITSGTGMGDPGNGQPAIEDVFDTDHPNPRIASELAGNAMLDAGVNLTVVRLPQVHDTVRQGLVTPFVEISREKGVAAYVGDGRNRWAPARQGTQRETKWFYERARGQYADAQSKLTAAEQKRFRVEYPKTQMFTKTDLAKFENVFDDHPRWVNLGSQKNFARYALRIGKEWEKSSDSFNELYFKRAIARAILFRATEKLVSGQPWYNGGYRANIVAYSLSMLGEIAKRRKATVDYQRIWDAQAVDDVLSEALAIIAAAVNEDIIRPPQGISNISEWCKRDGCWTRLLDKADNIAALLPEKFRAGLMSTEDNRHEARGARQTQKIDNGIEAQRRVFDIPSSQWSLILKEGANRKLFTPKEVGILRIAEQMPSRIPTERQSAVLLDILDRAQQEGFV